LGQISVLDSIVYFICYICMMTIVQLAKIAELSVQTIRYYESIKLLSKPNVKESGYRVYDGSYIERLNFIKKAKELNFTLSEIRAIIKFDESSDVYEIASSKLKDIRSKILNYKELEKKLDKLIKGCPAKGSVDNCSIIKSIRK